MVIIVSEGSSLCQDRIVSRLRFPKNFYFFPKRNRLLVFIMVIVLNFTMDVSFRKVFNITSQM